MESIILLLAIISSILAFVIIYAVVKKQVSKLFIIVAVLIELCIIAAIYFNNPVYFGLLGILGVTLQIIAKVKKRKR